MKSVLTAIAILIGTAGLAMAHGPGGHGGGHGGPGGHFGGGHFGGGHPGGGGHFGGGHFGGPRGGRFWGGVWYPYGIGPCWQVTPVGYVWICN